MRDLETAQVKGLEMDPALDLETDLGLDLETVQQTDQGLDREMVLATDPVTGLDWDQPTGLWRVQARVRESVRD